MNQAEKERLAKVGENVTNPSSTPGVAHLKTAAW